MDVFVRKQYIYKKSSGYRKVNTTFDNSTFNLGRAGLLLIHCGEVITDPQLSVSLRLKTWRLRHMSRRRHLKA